MPTYIHKPRTYLHFDPPTSADHAEALVTNPERVAWHAFYPFLGFTVTTPKIQKGLDGFLIKKDKKRPIKLAAHLDAAIYSHYAKILAEGYEKEVAKRGIGNCVIAFRKTGGHGRNNIAFAQEVFDFIHTHRPCEAIGLDIEKFFDRLDHERLKQRWQHTLGVGRLPADHFHVFESLADFRWADRTMAFHAVGISPHNPKPKGLNRNRICTPKEFREQIRGSGLIWSNPEQRRHRGIPQGAPISALLSNIYMLEFDVAMQGAVALCGGLYRRYCDDIMILVPPAEAVHIERLATTEIQKLNLTINIDKTTRAIFPAEEHLPAENGKKIQYLGFDYDGCQKLIRASSLGRYYGKMRRGVQLARLTRTKCNKIEAKTGQQFSGLKTRQLYIRYSYLIRRRFRRKKSGHDRQNENFITYAYRAAKEMRSPEIKRQVRNHFSKLRAEIRKSIG